MRCRRLLSLIAIAGTLSSIGSAVAVATESEKLFLHKNWQLHSSCEVKASGAEISSAGFDTSGWHHTDVPSTVVGALVTDNTYPDPGTYCPSPAHRQQIRIAHV